MYVQSKLVVHILKAQRLRYKTHHLFHYFSRSNFIIISLNFEILINLIGMEIRIPPRYTPLPNPIKKKWFLVHNLILLCQGKFLKVMDDDKYNTLAKHRIQFFVSLTNLYIYIYIQINSSWFSKDRIINQRCNCQFTRLWF